MKNKEKILRYLSGEMNKREIEQFEKEKTRSGELKKDFDKTVDLISQVQSLSDVEVNDAYFTGIIPKIKNRIEKSGRKKKVYRYSYATALLLIVLAGIYISINKNNGEILTETQMEKIINGEIPNELITDVLSTETIDLKDAEIKMDDFNFTEDYFKCFTESDFILFFNSLPDEELNELSDYLKKTKKL